MWRDFLIIHFVFSNLHHISTYRNDIVSSVYRFFCYSVLTYQRLSDMSQMFTERRNKDRELNKLDEIVTDTNSSQATREIALILRGIGEEMSDTASTICNAVAQMKITEERLSRAMEEVVKQLADHQRQDEIRIARQVGIDEHRRESSKKMMWAFGLFWGICSAAILAVGGYSLATHITYEKKIAVIEKDITELQKHKQ